MLGLLTLLLTLAVDIAAPFSCGPVQPYLFRIFILFLFWIPKTPYGLVFGKLWIGVKVAWISIKLRGHNSDIAHRDTYRSDFKPQESDTNQDEMFKI